MTSRYSLPEQLVTVPRLAGLVVHRDGPVLALRQELSSDGKRYVTHPWAVPRDSAPVQLTHGDHGVQEVRPAASGAVWFTSERPVAGDEDKRTRLWLLPEHGEARMVLDAPEGISSLELGGDRLFFVSGLYPAARGAQDEFARNREIHDRRDETGVSGILYDSAPFRYWDHDLPAADDALWFLDTAAVAEGADPAASVHRVELPEGRLGEFSVAPDGTWVLAEISTLLPAGTQRSQLWRLPVAPEHGDEAVLLHDTDEAEMWAPAAVSPDGTRVLLGRQRLWREGVSMAVSVWLHDVATGEETEVVPADDHWAQEPRWIDDESFVCTSDHRGRGIVLRVHCPRGGRTRVETIAGGADQDWTYSAVAPAGEQFVGLRASYTHPSELVRWPLTGAQEPAPVAGLVPEDTVPGRVEEVTATGEDGTQVRAWLALPHADDDAAPHPLLVSVHGGPWGSNNQWSWRWNPWPFVAAGYAVLLPDPAISTGYGQAMIDRGQQELGGAPFTDVMALTEAATRRADIDPERQALMGGSYGGYMANWVATQTGDRFRCIVTHASLWNLDTMGATTDNTVWREALEPAQAAVYSPHRFVERIRVPLLVIHGDKDYRVPISQGIELWADLQQRTRVEGHRFLYYPDEGHWILKPANARTWYETVLAFVDEHVLGRRRERPELLG